MSISISPPASIAIIILGFILISLTIPECVRLLRVLTKVPIPYVKKLATKVFLIGVGIVCIALGLYMLLKELRVNVPSTACVYDEAVQSDTEAIPWLIRREAEAVVARDLEMIKPIFASNATIILHDNGQIKTWNNPLDYYDELLRKSTHSSAKNTEIKAILVDGDTAYYTAGSEGTVTNHKDGQVTNYFNPGGSNQWTLKKTGGCWRIVKFEINAYGIPFP